MFAVTSGTTADSKLIPVTTRFLDDYRQGWQRWGIGTYTQHPELQRLNILQISSSHRKFTTPDGTPCGNISGLVASMQNPIVRTLYTIPSAVAEISDPDLRRRIIVRLALSDPHAGMLITANPSTLVQLWEIAERNSEQLIDEIRAGGDPSGQLSAAFQNHSGSNFVRILCVLGNSANFDIRKDDYFLNDAGQDWERLVFGAEAARQPTFRDFVTSSATFQFETTDYTPARGE